MRRNLLMAAIGCALVPAGAPAQPANIDRPAALKRLTDCRAIADQMRRLACYDREVAAVDAGEARKDLVILDRQQLSKARKTLFGLTLPNLAIFGNDNPETEGVSHIESKIKAVSQTPYGKWIFDLPDGARWAQIDSKELPIHPKGGHDIKIRKAALGSYLANVNGQVAIRVQRLR